MKMDDMVKRLEGLGFEVDRYYCGDTATYEFTITKGSNHVKGYFEFKPFDSPAARHERQLRFIDDLVHRYNEDFGTDFKVYDEIIVVKGLFTGARGKIVATQHSSKYAGKRAYRIGFRDLTGYLREQADKFPYFEFDEIMLTRDHDQLAAYVNTDITETKNIYKAMVNSLYGFKGPFVHIPHIENVIFNPPATIVFWADGTKTVVKCQDYDDFDPEKGLTMAISKKALGNKGNYYNTIKKWVDKYEVESLYPRFPLLDDNWWEEARDKVSKLKEVIENRINSKKELSDEENNNNYTVSDTDI